MSALIDYDDVAEGDPLPGLLLPLRRLDLIMYAGASGDFNPIHWSERIATSVGLPNVIAHGMLTMAVAARVITEWVGDPGAVSELSGRFVRPVPIPDDDQGTQVRVTAAVAAKLPDRRVRVELQAVIDDADEALVLDRAAAVVQL